MKINISNKEIEQEQFNWFMELKQFYLGENSLEPTYIPLNVAIYLWDMHVTCG